VDGVLVIDKPAGMTSHDVVARVRRLLGITRVGHTGTLDPMATGVLPLVVGRATRLARYLSASDKAYDATIRLGFATTTYDAQGQALGDGRWALGEEQGRRGRLQPALYAPPSADAVRAALAAFVGTHPQRPPAFSAKKVGGVPAYKRARREQPVDLPPVEVTLHSVDDVEVEGDLVRLRLVCSAGYYVRSLAHDLGEALGCGAHLAALRRTRSGEFTLDQAVMLEDRRPASGDRRPGTMLGTEPSPGAKADDGSAECPVPSAECRQAVIPLSCLLPWAPRVTLTEEGETRVGHGRSIEASHTTGWEGAVQPGRVPSAECRVPEVVRVFSPDGRLLALATPAANGRWPLHPGVVL